jgi:hypothetical protein
VIPSPARASGAINWVDPDLKGKVVIHHAIPKFAFLKYRGSIPLDGLHEIANLRGIPKELDPVEHQRKIHNLWRTFYLDHTTSATAKELRDFALAIDDGFGHLLTLRPMRSK